MAKKKTEKEVVTWRVKEELRRRFVAAAAHNEVSVNNEITRRIEESFARSELASLRQNVDRLSTLYEQARINDEDRAMQYLEYAQKVEQLRNNTVDERQKHQLLQLATAWLNLAERTMKLGSPDLAPRGQTAPAETNEERQARLRASADDLLKNAKRGEARSAYDLGAEPREWDTRARSVPPRSLSDQEAKRAKERGHIRRRGEHS